jgi:hypothetical protein
MVTIINSHVEEHYTFLYNTYFVVWYTIHTYLPTIMHMNLPLHLPFIPTLPTHHAHEPTTSYSFASMRFCLPSCFLSFQNYQEFSAHGHSRLYNKNNGVCLSMSFILTSVKPNHLTPFINITFIFLKVNNLPLSNLSI